MISGLMSSEFVESLPRLSRPVPLCEPEDEPDDEPVNDCAGAVAFRQALDKVSFVPSRPQTSSARLRLTIAAG